MSDVRGNCFYLAFPSKNPILLQYIWKLLFYWNAFINYAKFIYKKSFGKILCFSTEGKMVFSFFFSKLNVILYFCPFKRDTKVINSFALYRCKYLLRSISMWWISYNFRTYLTALLNACFSQTLLAFKVVINSCWKLFKVPVDKTEFLLQLQAFPTAKTQDQHS